MREEFINQEGLAHAMKFIKCCTPGSYEIREIARKIIDMVFNDTNHESKRRLYNIPVSCFELQNF